MPQKKHTGKIILIIVIALAAIICVLLFSGVMNNPAGMFIMDANAQDFNGFTETEDIQQSMQNAVDASSFTVQMNVNPRFNPDTMRGDVAIINPQTNNYVCKVALTMDDGGETVLQTDGIAPGQTLLRANLSKQLPAGEYPATATFTALDKESKEEVGNVQVAITLTVGD